MYVVCIVSQCLMRCGLAVMVAICPYSSRGRTNILKRRIIVVFDGPYLVLCSVLSLMVLCFALDLICVVVFER